MKKSALYILLCILISFNAFAQGIDGVIIDPNNATTRDASAVFQSQSTTQGMLTPRMTAAQRAAIPVSAARNGLLVYQTDATSGFWYYTGTVWVLISSSSGLGHIENRAVDNAFATGQAASYDITGNAEISGTLEVNGNAGFGTTTPGSQLDVRYRDASTNIYRASDATGQYRWRVDQGFDMFLTNAASTDLVKIGQGTSWFNSGFVSIGNSAPQHQLSVGLATADAQTVTIRGYSNSPASWKGGGAFGYTSAAVIMGELGGVAQLGGHSATLNAWANLAINSGGGSVGIGTSVPGSKLDVQNGSLTVGTLYGTNVMYGTLGGFDTRATNPTPETYNMGVVNEFKGNAANGLSDGGTYNSVLTVRQWSSGTDWSGGGTHQLGFTQNGNMWQRYSQTTGSWGAWNKILTSGNISGNINGTVNYIPKFTSANSIGNSTTTDDGTTVTTSSQFDVTGGTGTNYTTAPIEIRTTAIAPRLAFHYSGVVASQIAVENSGRIAIRDNPGTGYENFVARDITSSANLIVGGVVTSISGFAPANNAIRMTPNMHINTTAGNAIIINWDNGAVGGGTQQFRVGNGTGTDQFYVRADGQFYGRYFADLDDATYYVDPNSTSNTASKIRGGTLHGPNVSWSKYLLVGGDGRGAYVDNADVASVSTTDGNLHVDASSAHGLYLNFYDGNVINFGNGANGIIGYVNTTGSVSMNTGYQIGGTASNGTYLRGNGTNFVQSAIQAGDLPAGSGSYIQNQTASAQAANYWINGTAQVGSTFTNLNGRLLTSNQGGWQADGVTPQMVISANTASTNRAATIGLDLHNDNTTNNTYSPFITFSRRSNSTSYNSAFAAIGAQVTGQGSDANWCAGDLIFATENAQVNGMGERMRITSQGRVNILQNQGGDPNFAGLDDPTSANGRAQLVLSSSYSDLTIASSEGNDNHGSTLTFASYNPANVADYRKFVINQGNWGARFGYLDFGFADAGGRSNPHSNINGTDNVITLNGINKRLGVAIMSPEQTLHVNGKSLIRRGGNTMGANANEGQLEIANNSSGDAYISFHRQGAWGAQFGLESDNWFTTKGWSPGGGGWNNMRLGTLDIRGTINCIGGYCPPVAAIRLTPNMHINSNAGNAVILNWDNGTTGATQTLRVGNGSGGDVFYVYADGQTFTSNWFRPLGQTGLYFQNYGGGWHMTDATWIRAYNAKPVLCPGGVAGYGNAIGTVHGIAANMYANYNNAATAGIVVSDDGGIGDYNDSWLQWRATSGLYVSSQNGNNLTYFNMNHINGGLVDKFIIPSNGNWGYVGTSGNYFYRMHSGQFVTVSRRELKREITPVSGTLEEKVMADIAMLKPSFYKFKIEEDEWVEGKETKFRAAPHIGLIVDEAPDYIQSDDFGGVDIYALATLAALGAKVNGQAIKELKAAVGISNGFVTVNDFGTVELSGNEMWVNFTDEFIQKLNSKIPAITVTPDKEGLILSVVEKSAKGFKIKATGTITDAAFDYIAMAKVEQTRTENAEEVSPEYMKTLSVEQATKEKVMKWWAEAPDRLKAQEDKAREEAVIITEQRRKELGLPADFVGPEKSGVHDPKANDANALIKEAAKQVEINAPQYSPNKDEIPNK